jgi:hypothetical protein
LKDNSEVSIRRAIPTLILGVVFAVLAITGTWWAYTVETICPETIPNQCVENPRLVPAIVLTAAVTALVATTWVFGVRAGSGKRFPTTFVTVVLGAMVILGPAITLMSGGFDTGLL